MQRPYDIYIYYDWFLNVLFVIRWKKHVAHQTIQLHDRKQEAASVELLKDMNVANVL